MMDFRARLVHQQAEAAERRRLDLAEQSSRLKTAEERIRIWERIHEVNLAARFGASAGGDHRREHRTHRSGRAR